MLYGERYVVRKGKKKKTVIFFLLVFLGVGGYFFYPIMRTWFSADKSNISISQMQIAINAPDSVQGKKAKDLGISEKQFAHLQQAVLENPNIVTNYLRLAAYLQRGLPKYFEDYLKMLLYQTMELPSKWGFVDLGQQTSKNQNIYKNHLQFSESILGHALSLMEAGNMEKNELVIYLLWSNYLAREQWYSNAARYLFERLSDWRGDQVLEEQIKIKEIPQLLIIAIKQSDEVFFHRIMTKLKKAKDEQDASIGGPQDKQLLQVYKMVTSNEALLRALLAWSGKQEKKSKDYLKQYLSNYKAIKDKSSLPALANLFYVHIVLANRDFKQAGNILDVLQEYDANWAEVYLLKAKMYTLQKEPDKAAEMKKQWQDRQQK